MISELSIVHFQLIATGIAANCAPRSKRLYYLGPSLSERRNPSKNQLFPVFAIRKGTALQPPRGHSVRQIQPLYRAGRNIRLSPSVRQLPGKSYLHIICLRWQALPANRYIGHIKSARPPEIVPGWAYLLSGKKKTKKSG